jgi:biotin carboxyl carrier protein
MKLEIEIQGRLRIAELVPGTSPGQYRITLDGQPLEVEARLLRPGVLSIIIDGRSHRVVLEHDAPAGNGNDPALYLEGRRLPYRIEDPRSLKTRRAHAGGSDGPKVIKASMPGRVVRVLVELGQAVEANQSVVVIEAMKMQNELKSPKAGTVVEMRIAPGDTVTAGDVLAVID